MNTHRSEYNPYRDPAIHTTQPNPDVAAVDDKLGFNDVLRHADAVNGFRMPKRLAHYPRPLRTAVRVLAILWVGSFGIALLVSLLHTIRMMLS